MPAIEVNKMVESKTIRFLLWDLRQRVFVGHTFLDQKQQTLILLILHMQ